MKCTLLLSLSQNDVHPTIESTLGFIVEKIILLENQIIVRLNVIKI